MFPIDKGRILKYLYDRKEIKNDLIKKREEENRAYRCNPMDKGITGIEYSRGALIELHGIIARIENDEFDYPQEDQE